MTPGGKAAGRAGAIAVGALVGALVIFGVDGLTSGDEGSRSESNDRLVEVTNDFGRGSGMDADDEGAQTPSPEAKSEKPEPEIGARVFLAWAPGSLPAETEQRIEKMPEVRDATTVYAGLDWIHSSRRAGGEFVERYRNGYEIPFEIAAIEPREYARFVEAKDRASIRALDGSKTLLAETSTDLRGGGVGLRLELESSKLAVSGVVSDLTTNGYEALVSTPPPAHWRRADRFVLAHLRRPEDRGAVTKKIQSLLPAGEPLRTRSQGENPFLRYGDAVLPQLLVKEAFGEFAARNVGDGSIAIEDRWVQKNIREDTVPLLGRVTCHRLLFPQLKEALRDVKREGLGHTIDPGQGFGCFSARFINSDPQGRVSHHSWGIALDVNVRENAFGTRPNMDTRVVDIFEDRWGFTWGGRWIIPDGMHFEWIKFP